MSLNRLNFPSDYWSVDICVIIDKHIDQQKPFGRDLKYNIIYGSRKEGFRHLFINTIKYLINIDVPPQLAHFCVLHQC